MILRALQIAALVLVSWYTLPCILGGILGDFRTKDFVLGTVFCLAAGTIASRLRGREESKSVYGLQHGRLHIDTHVPMWMNMGYWKIDEHDSFKTKSLAAACRDLLELVLAEAALSRNLDKTRPRLLIDVGFGCGEQTIYLMSKKPIRPSDELWWDGRNHCVRFDQYIGITRDNTQFQYAKERVYQLENDKVSIFRADASQPHLWSGELLKSIKSATSKCHETWLLALDTAYHFSPSRWVLVEHAHKNLDASFMAFDLCLSPNATVLQKLLLRTLTTIMGAPWSNFVTPEAYRQELIRIGYAANAIQMTDISEHVFTPLAIHMEEQDGRLKTLGLGLGTFQAAGWLFGWWGSTGVVRGVIVTAKHKAVQI